MKKSILMCGLLCLLLLGGCKKEMTTFDILAISEEEASDPAAGGTKTYLWNEMHVFWQSGDQINVCYMDKKEASKATFQEESTDGNKTQAIFTLESEIKVPQEGTGNFLALFPYNSDNVLGTMPPTIQFPQEQGYYNDKSFGKAACPMVAYAENASTSSLVRMQFHNLAGLVRVQLIDSINNTNNSNPVHRLTSLEFKTTSSSPCKQLSGPFKVNDPRVNAPSMTAQNESNNMVTITPNGTTGIELPVHNNSYITDNEPLTFYLVLPALDGTGNNNYQIEMTVRGTDITSKANVKVTKTFNVTIRRNGITKMPTLTVHRWAPDESTTDFGEVSGGITGNGTNDRPFLLYSYRDLVQLRDACNNNTKINGKVVGEGVYVRIMRAITLDNTTWTEGISDFKGIMTYGASFTAAEQGIINNTDVPLFESINAKGEVYDLTVTGAKSWNQTDQNALGFSPLCRTNNGKIQNCMVGDGAEYSYKYTGVSNTVGVGGICVDNYGRIMNCGCRGQLNSKKVGGICLYNHSGAYVTQCFIPSPMRANVGSDQSVEAGGICYKNEGTVNDCYFAANLNLSNTRWGGIVYENTGSGSISNSYVDASGIIQSNNSVGGVVHTMSGGTVDNCWSDADLFQVELAEGLGGVVYEMTGGVVKNSYRRRSTGNLTCKVGVMGGFVAKMQGGLIANCYVWTDMSQTVCQTKGIFVGSFTAGTVENCYGEQYSARGNATNFYGTITSNATAVDCFSQAAQTGVTTYSSYSDLLSRLQGHSWSTEASAVGGFKAWVAGGANEPPVHSN